LQPTTLARDCHPSPVGLDEIDSTAYVCIPKVIRGDSDQVFLAQVSALAAEGGRGAAMRRLLAREVALARAGLRLRECLANLELQKLGGRRFDAEKFDLLEKAVQNAYRRLMMSIDRLTRLDAAQAPRIRISAALAQVDVGGVQ
jgi:hypothetical protein